MKIFQKDPSDVLDYTFRWQRWLDGDTIVTSTWTTESGLTIDSESETIDSATVWVSGGRDGEEYIVTNTITTITGRTKEKSFILKVEDQ